VSRTSISTFLFYYLKLRRFAVIALKTISFDAGLFVEKQARRQRCVISTSHQRCAVGTRLVDSLPKGARKQPADDRTMEVELGAGEIAPPPRGPLKWWFSAT
jgi:hypothetical protein